MEEQREDLRSIELIEADIAALQQKLQDDFTQMEKVYLKAQALSKNWLETQRHVQAKVEEAGQQTVPEATISCLNIQLDGLEETEASLKSELSRALAHVREKEATAAKLRGEVAVLEQKVEAACREVAQVATRLEEGAHSARLVLEASLDDLLQHVTQKVSGTKQPEEGNRDGAEGPAEGAHVPPRLEDAVRGDRPGPQEPPLQEEDPKST